MFITINTDIYSLQIVALRLHTRVWPLTVTGCQAVIGNIYWG